MTKEETMDCFDPSNYPHVHSVYKAMDQYAEQNSVAFAEYLAEWGWEMCDLNGPHAGKWVSEMNIQYGFETISNLFQLFLKDKTKTP